MFFNDSLTTIAEKIIKTDSVLQKFSTQKKELKDVNKKYKQLTNKYEAHRKELVELKKNYVKLQNNVFSCVNKYTEAQKAKEILQKQYEQSQEKVRELNNELEKNRKQIITFEKKVQPEVLEAKKTLNPKNKKRLALKIDYSHDEEDKKELPLQMDPDCKILDSNVWKSEKTDNNKQIDEIKNNHSFELPCLITPDSIKSGNELPNLQTVPVDSRLRKETDDIKNPIIITVLPLSDGNNKEQSSNTSNDFQIASNFSPIIIKVPVDEDVLKKNTNFSESLPDLNESSVNVNPVEVDNNDSIKIEHKLPNLKSIPSEKGTKEKNQEQISTSCRNFGISTSLPPTIELPLEDKNSNCSKSFPNLNDPIKNVTSMETVDSNSSANIFDFSLISSNSPTSTKVAIKSKFKNSDYKKLLVCRKQVIILMLKRIGEVDAGIKLKKQQTLVSKNTIKHKSFQKSYYIDQLLTQLKTKVEVLVKYLQYQKQRNYEKRCRRVHLRKKNHRKKDIGTNLNNKPEENDENGIFRNTISLTDMLNEMMDVPSLLSPLSSDFINDDDEEECLLQDNEKQKKHEIVNSSTQTDKELEYEIDKNRESSRKKTATSESYSQTDQQFAIKTVSKKTQTLIPKPSDKNTQTLISKPSDKNTQTIHTFDASVSSVQKVAPKNEIDIQTEALNSTKNTKMKKNNILLQTSQILLKRQKMFDMKLMMMRKKLARKSNKKNEEKSNIHSCACMSKKCCDNTTHINSGCHISCANTCRKANGQMVNVHICNCLPHAPCGTPNEYFPNRLSHCNHSNPMLQNACSHCLKANGVFLNGTPHINFNEHAFMHNCNYNKLHTIPNNHSAGFNNFFNYPYKQEQMTRAPTPLHRFEECDNRDNDIDFRKDTTEQASLNKTKKKARSISSCTNRSASRCSVRTFSTSSNKSTDSLKRKARTKKKMVLCFGSDLDSSFSSLESTDQNKKRKYNDVAQVSMVTTKKLNTAKNMNKIELRVKEKFGCIKTKKGIAKNNSEKSWTCNNQFKMKNTATVDEQSSDSIITSEGNARNKEINILSVQNFNKKNSIITELNCLVTEEDHTELSQSGEGELVINEIDDATVPNRNDKSETNTDLNKPCPQTIVDSITIQSHDSNALIEKNNVINDEGVKLDDKDVYQNIQNTTNTLLINNADKVIENNYVKSEIVLRNRSVVSTVVTNQATIKNSPMPPGKRGRKRKVESILNNVNVISKEQAALMIKLPLLKPKTQSIAIRNPKTKVSKLAEDIDRPKALDEEIDFIDIENHSSPLETITELIKKSKVDLLQKEDNKNNVNDKNEELKITGRNCELEDARKLELSQVGEVAISIFETSENNFETFLQEFIKNDFTEENLKTTSMKLSKLNPTGIASLIVFEVLNDASSPLCLEFTPPIIPLTKIQQRLITLIEYLQNEEGVLNFRNIVLKEFRTIILDEYFPVPELTRVTRMFVSLCRLRFELQRVRLLMCEIALVHSTKLLPVIYVIMMCWPEVVPPNGGYKRNLLIYSILYSIMWNTCAEPGYNKKALQNFIENYYEYKKAGIMIMSFANDLLNEFKEHFSKTTIIAILIFCKHQTEDIVHKYIVKGLLLHIESCAQALQNNDCSTELQQLADQSLKLILQIIHEFDNYNAIQEVLDSISKLNQICGGVLCGKNLNLDSISKMSNTNKDTVKDKTIPG